MSRPSCTGTPHRLRRTVAWHGSEPPAVDPARFRCLVEPFGPGNA